MRRETSQPNETLRSSATDTSQTEAQPPAKEGLAGLEKLVHAIAVFHECSYDFVEAVILRMKKLLCQPGTVIVEQGAIAPRAMYLIIWGSVDVVVGDQTCTTLREGDTFGEAQMLDIFERWTARVVAQTQCVVCELTETAVKEIFQDYPEEQDYFSSITEYYHIRNEEWMPADVRQALRRTACLRQASEEFLAALEEGMERRLMFAGDCLLTEGEEEELMALLCDGEVVVEVGGKVVRALEVPSLPVRFAFSEESGLDHSGAPRSGSSLSMYPDSPDVHRDIDDSPDLEAEELLQRNLMMGPVIGVDVNQLPEAAVFGEEVLLGVSSRSASTVQMRKMSDVRILHRRTLLKVLPNFPEDEEMINRFLRDHDEAFPRMSKEDVVGELPQVPFAEEFLEYLQNHSEERIFFPGDIITLDSLHQNLSPAQLLPTLNISFARINVGHVKVIIPPGAERNHSVINNLSQYEILEPGEKISGSTLWAGVQYQALEIVYCSVLHRGVVSRALEEHPREREQVVPVLVMQYQQESQQQAAEKVKSHREAHRVAKILRERSIFAKASQEFLGEILQFGAIRVFMPGDRIIEQGADGNSMFILSVGIAHVVKESMSEADHRIIRTLTNIGGLTYGGVFGELVMLGVQSKRSASIVASSICCTWEVHHHKILSILDRHPKERTNFLRLVEEHLEKLAAPRIIYHQLFTRFSQQFRTLIGVNCERKLYFPGEMIVREGTTGERMYVMNLGSATVEVANQHVMQIRGGSHFGFGCMASTTGKDKYNSTVITETMCQVLIITRSTYHHALQKYPEMMEAAKALEAEEVARVKKQMGAFNKMVQRRRGLLYIIDALKFGVFSEDRKVNPSNRPLLSSVWTGWVREVKRTAQLRQDDEKLRVYNNTQIDKWLTKRREQFEHMRPELEYQKLVKLNMNSRGPLKLGLGKIPSPRSQVERSNTDPQAIAPPAPLASTVPLPHFMTEESLSPYKAPAPVWRRDAIPLSARQTRQLPPLAEAIQMPLNLA
mmetsp:Transcript_16359/g.28705  ORF Transcript_16359/g.28705 Transcript_16359/m.28705 type:complete len:1010 (+) Transcript_16359:85-3114(+)